MTQRDTPSPALESLLQRWHMLAERERRIVAAGLVLLVLAVAWLVLFEPAWVGRRALQSELPTLRTQLAQVEQLAAEANRLGAVSRANDSPQALQAQLEKSIDSAGLRPALAQLSSSGSLFDVRFKRVSHADWLAWLDTTTREMRLRVADVAVTREAGVGFVSVRLALEMPRAGER